MTTTKRKDLIGIGNLGNNDNNKTNKTTNRKPLLRPLAMLTVKKYLIQPIEYKEIKTGL